MYVIRDIVQFSCVWRGLQAKRMPREPLPQAARYSCLAWTQAGWSLIEPHRASWRTCSSPKRFSILKQFCVFNYSMNLQALIKGSAWLVHRRARWAHLISNNILSRQRNRRAALLLPSPWGCVCHWLVKDWWASPPKHVAPYTSF